MRRLARDQPAGRAAQPRTQVSTSRPSTTSPSQHSNAIPGLRAAASRNKPSHYATGLSVMYTFSPLGRRFSAG